jgi:hypothetical protein
MTRSWPLIVAIALAFPGPLAAKEHRSRDVTREFQREHPCPSTGKTSGACRGYRRDHIVPLACGGPDAVTNMQWQTTADAKAKDRWERAACPLVLQIIPGSEDGSRPILLKKSGPR